MSDKSQSVHFYFVHWFRQNSQYSLSFKWAAFKVTFNFRKRNKTDSSSEIAFKLAIYILSQEFSFNEESDCKLWDTTGNGVALTV